MRDSGPDRIAPDRRPREEGWGISAGLFAALVAGLGALVGIAARYAVHGDLNVIHCLLSLFFSVNLLICYWEVCLFFRRDYVEKRAAYWLKRRRETGRTPAREFLSTKVALRRIWSPMVWADVWATYSLFDGSFADRRTFGFNADIANGFATPIPTLVLYAAYTVHFLPAIVAGILGIMLFWQWTYVTSVYWVSFFVARRQDRITRDEMYTYIGAMNAPWVLCALVGLYVSVRLVVSGDYSVLGY